MKTKTAHEWELLTDEEWARIADLVLSAVVSLREGKKGNKGPLNKARALTNAVLQSIALSVPLIKVEHPEAHYSSWPTRSRFRRILCANEDLLLLQIIDLLDDSRPELYDCYLNRNRQSEHGVSKIPSTWGVDLSPLPFWNISGQPCLVDDGDGY